MSDNTYSFSMKVDDVFAIAGKGTVISGKITLGSVKLNEIITIIGGASQLNAKVTGIEVFNKVLPEAKCGENVGLLLDNVDKKNIKKGFLAVKGTETEILDQPLLQKLAKETRGQMEAVGLEFYEWSTGLDERVRPSHALMEGKLCKWADPTVYSTNGGKTWYPRPRGATLSHPGEEEGCRCTALSYEPELLGEI